MRGALENGRITTDLSKIVKKESFATDSFIRRRVARKLDALYALRRYANGRVLSGMQEGRIDIVQIILKSCEGRIVSAC